MKKCLVLAILLLCSSQGLLAQPQAEPASPNEFRRYEIFYAPLAYARQAQNNFSGIELEFAAQVHPRLALVADLTGHFQQSKYKFASVTQTQTDDVELWAYRFGPRWTLHRTDRYTIFAEALAGGSSLISRSTIADGDSRYASWTQTNGFGLAAGGGMDVAWKRWFAFRVLHIDYSYIGLDGLHQGIQIGAGVNFRFGKR